MGTTAISWGHVPLPAEIQEARAIAFAPGVSAVLPQFAGGYLVRRDGTVHPFGYVPIDGARPPGLRDVVDLEMGDLFAVALCADGSIKWWGGMGEPPMPDTPILVPPGLTNLSAIATSLRLGAALRADGRVLNWGQQWQLTFADPEEIDDAIAIAGGDRCLLALRRGGSVAAWGGGATPAYRFVMSQMRDIVDLAQGASQALLLRHDGQVLLVDGGPPVPGPSNVVAVAADGEARLVLKADGTVAGWGWGAEPPRGLTEVVQIYTRGYTSVAWTRAPYIARHPGESLSGPLGLVPGAALDLRVTAVDSGPLTYQWKRNGIDMPGATLAVLAIPETREVDTGIYSVTVRNQNGYAATSDEVPVAVGPPLIWLEPRDQHVPAYSNVCFRVAVASPGIPRFQWFHDGIAMVDETSEELSLEAVEPRHAGVYWVTVRNDFGGTRSASARLEVLRGAMKDQAQSVFCSWVSLREAAGVIRAAQTFTPSVSGQIDRVTFSGNPDAPSREWPILVTLTETVGGRPGGKALGWTVVRNLTAQATADFSDQFIFLRAGQSYAVDFSSQAPPSDSSLQYNLAACGDVGGDRYDGGQLWTIQPGTNWTPRSADLVFAAYVYPGWPSVHLESPRPGSPLHLGQDTVFRAEFADGIVASEVAFRVNGVLVGTDHSPPFEWDWVASEIGPGTVVAEALVGGEILRSDEVAIEVVHVGPSNDDFASRVVLSGPCFRTEVSTMGATLEANERPSTPEARGHTVWWEWFPDASGVAVVAVGGPARSNLVVTVVEGSSWAGALPVAQGNGTCSFDSVPGCTYLVRVDVAGEDVTEAPLSLMVSELVLERSATPEDLVQFETMQVSARRTHHGRTLAGVEFFRDGERLGTVSGNLDRYTIDLPLKDCGSSVIEARAMDVEGMALPSSPLKIAVRPANDDYEQAIEVTGYQVRWTCRNEAASRQSVDGDLGGHSIWYRWSPPADGMGYLKVRGRPVQPGPSFEALMAVFLGTQPSGQSLVSRVGGSVWNQRELRWRVTRGATYLIMVDGAFGEEGYLDVDLSLRPVNDRFLEADRLSGSPAQVFGSFRGASLEPGETGIPGSRDAGSLWWTWTAPATGKTRLSAATDGAAAWLGIGHGRSAADFAPLRTSGASFRLGPRVEFVAVRNSTYQITLAAPLGSDTDFTLTLEELGLHVSEPLEGSVFQAPANLRLKAQLPDPESAPETVDFYVNDAFLGQGVRPGYAYSWEAVPAGPYRIEARMASDSGAVTASSPIHILVYEGDELPTPRIFAGRESDCSFIIDAAGVLHVAGSYDRLFGLSGVEPSRFPRVVPGPAGTHRWTTIEGGQGPIVIPPVNSVNWAVGGDGVLYRNGEVSVPFPAGVRRWVKLDLADRTLHALGDDGVVYREASQPIEFPARLPWVDLAGSTTLAADGRAFLHTLDSEDLVTPVSLESPRPPGVQRWMRIEATKMIVILLGDDGHLYEGWSLAGRGLLAVPARIERPPEAGMWRAFAVGGYHVLALGGDGQLYGWGRNVEGQLGLGSTGEHCGRPTRVPLPPGVSAWTSLAAGLSHSLAIGNDCALYAWGAKLFPGELGLGWTGSAPSPVRVANVGSLCGYPVVHTEGETTRLPDGTFRVRFKSDLNRLYTIQYADQIPDWKSVPSPVVGAGSWTEWIDAGPPLTEKHPDEVQQRFYRVLFAP